MFSPREDLAGGCQCKGARPRPLKLSVKHSVFSKGTSWHEASNVKVLGPIHSDVQSIVLLYPGGQLA